VRDMEPKNLPNDIVDWSLVLQSPNGSEVQSISVRELAELVAELNKKPSILPGDHE
jgi:hypothetical protein